MGKLEGETDKIQINLKNNMEEEKNNVVISTKYCGLYNQGGTCYMNSLLQSLFMTAEFRINLFSWRYDEVNHGAKEDCIPFQLQKLFCRMQCRVRSAEYTKDLTKSFQWNSGEVFQQHDIQELCRVLFEAIEISFGLEDTNFINQLYEGNTKWVVKCLECDYLSERNDKFLDITLPVRNEFEKIYNNSLEMALCNFLKSEKLTGDNRYACGKCDRKTDALKYCKFDKLPKILFFQLGRFEFDYNTFSRKKINDLVTFPLVLNMNIFMKDYQDIIEYYTESKLKLLTERSIPTEEDVQKEIEEYLQHGPLVYELYSIVIHSGTAMGGHYFAWIKSFEDNKWYCFNDSNVYEVKARDISNIWGSVRAGVSAGTGYVLMYRQYNPEKITSIDNNMIPEEIAKTMEEENVRILEEERIMKEKLNSINLKFKVGETEKNININKTCSTKELKLKVMKEFNIENDEKNVRIRVISNNGKLLDTFPMENKTVDDYSIYAFRTYSLEIRDSEDIPFDDFDPNLINVSIFLWNDSFEDLEEKDFVSHNLKINRQEPLYNLKNKIYEQFNINKEKELYCFKRLETTTTDLFANSYELNKEIYLNAIYDGSKIYVETKERGSDSSTSKFKTKFEEKNQDFFVNFNFPLDPVLVKSGKVTLASYRFENQLKMSKKSTVNDLRREIAKYLALSEKEFIMKRFTHNGMELKNLSETLEFHNSKTINVYVEYGVPLGENEVKLTCLYCQTDYSKFMIFPYKMTEIGMYVIDSHMTIGDLKVMICEEIKKKLSVELDLSSVLVREHLMDKPTRIYRDDTLIMQYSFVDGKKICFQEYKASKLHFDPDYNQVTIREWDPSNWTLSPAVELLVNKSITFEQLAEILNQLFPHIEKQNLSAYKIVNSHNLYMDNFDKFCFENLVNKNTFRLEQYPFFLNSDGNMLLIKDDTKQFREPTDQERSFYCRPSQEEVRMNIVPSVSTKPPVPSGNKITDMVKLLEQGNIDFNKKAANNTYRIKEKGLKIGVKKNMTEEEKKNIEEKKESNNSFVQINNQSQSHPGTNKIDIQINSKNLDDVKNSDNSPEEENLYDLDNIQSLI